MNERPQRTSNLILISRLLVAKVSPKLNSRKLPSLTTTSSFSSLDEGQSFTINIHPSLLSLTSKSLLKRLAQTHQAFTLNLKPLATLDGSGGSYILRAPTKQSVAVFKPADEEPYAKNNPRGFLHSSDITMRTGHVPGTGCYREVAAYLLDHGGICGVPETTLAEASHRAFNNGGGGFGNEDSQIISKVGSFQVFAQSECTMDDLSPSVISIEEVQKIALLDLRLMNADRNAANLLARRRRSQDGSSTWSLIPIDHGYTLRNKVDVGWCDWCWLEWPQVKEPLTKKLRNYVLGLDVEKDVTILKDRLNIGDAECDVFRASCNLLIKGVAKGLTLYEIATMCCRMDDLGEVPSVLEKILINAAELSYHAVDNEKFNHRVASSAIMSSLTMADRKESGTICKVMSSVAISHSASCSSTSRENVDVLEDCEGDDVGTSEPLSISSVVSSAASSPSVRKRSWPMPPVMSTSSDSDSSSDDCDHMVADVPPPPPQLKLGAKSHLGPDSSASSPKDIPSGGLKSATSNPVTPSDSDFQVQGWADTVVSNAKTAMTAPASTRKSSIDSEASSESPGSPRGFWRKRPSSPVKSVCESFTDTESNIMLTGSGGTNTTNVSTFSTPPKATGEGVLVDVYLAKSAKRSKSNVSLLPMNFESSGGVDDDDGDDGSGACGDNLNDGGDGWAIEGLSSKDMDEDFVFDHYLSAQTEALTFVDTIEEEAERDGKIVGAPVGGVGGGSRGEEGGVGGAVASGVAVALKVETGAFSVAPGRVARSKSYTALSTLAWDHGGGDQSPRPCRRRFSRISSLRGGKKKEEILRGYFSKFVSLISDNEISKMT